MLKKKYDLVYDTSVYFKKKSFFCHVGYFFKTMEGVS